MWGRGEGGLQQSRSTSGVRQFLQAMYASYSDTRDWRSCFVLGLKQWKTADCQEHSVISSPWVDLTAVRDRGCASAAGWKGGVSQSGRCAQVLVGLSGQATRQPKAVAVRHIMCRQYCNKRPAPPLYPSYSGLKIRVS
jgi:hypothetical protein